VKERSEQISYAASRIVAVSSAALLPKIVSSCQRYFQPMMPRKFFSVARNETATQRPTMAASRQRHPHFRIRSPDCGLSIQLVVARQRCSEDGMLRRLVVKHSYNLAAEGDSCSSQSASFRSHAEGVTTCLGTPAKRLV